MENTISILLDMDRQARETVDAAKQRSQQIVADAARKSEKLGEEGSRAITEQTNKRFAEIKNASDKEIARILYKADNKCAELDEKMAAGKPAWKKEILDRVLGKIDN